MKKTLLLKFFNYWPPYLGAGIRITKIDAEMRSIEVEMKAHFWNRNYVGTHFGGSLYSMVDPFLMLMLIENLGPAYSVWDKSATIRFKKATTARVRAKFELSLEEIETIRTKVDAEKKVAIQFVVQILDDQQQLIAEVDKVLSVKKKEA